MNARTDMTAYDAFFACRYAETHKNVQPGTRTAQYLRRIGNEIANKITFSAHMNNDAQQQDTTMIQRTHDLTRMGKAILICRLKAFTAQY